MHAPQLGRLEGYTQASVSWENCQLQEGTGRYLPPLLLRIRDGRMNVVPAEFFTSVQAL